MNKTENNMITQFREANRLLATVLPAPEAFKVALSLFIVHCLFNSANSRIRAALGKRSHKTDFPTDDMFEQADRLLSAIHPEGSAAIGLGDYTKKLAEAVQRELIDIICGVDVVNSESNILYGLLDIDELRDILPGRHVDYKPECLSILLESLFVSNEMYRDRFQSVDPFVIHSDYQSDTEDFSARGLSETEDGALWNFYNYAIDPSFVMRHVLDYIDGSYHWEEGGNGTIICNPIKHMRDLSEPERYAFFEKEMNTELSVLSPTGKMAIVLPIEYLSKEGPIQQTLIGLVRSDSVTAVIQMPEKLFEPEYVGATCLVFVNKSKKSSYNGKIAFVMPNYEALHDISTVEIQSIAEYCNRLISNWIESAVVSASDNMNLLPWSHISALSAELNDPSIKWAPLSSLCKIKSGKQGTSLKAESLSPHIWDMYFSERPHAKSGMLRDYDWDVSGLDDYEIETKSLLVALHSDVEPKQIADVDMRAQIFDPEKSREKGIGVGKGMWGLIPRGKTIDIKYLYFQLHSPIVKKQIEAIANKPGRKNPGLTKKELGSLKIPVRDSDAQRTYVTDESLSAIKQKELRDREARQSLARNLGVSIKKIKQEAEFKIVSILNHSLEGAIGRVKTAMHGLQSFVVRNKLNKEPLQEKFIENQKMVIVEDEIAKALDDLKHMHELLEDTRRLVSQGNRALTDRDFSLIDIKQLFTNRILAKYKNHAFRSVFDCPDGIKVVIHESSFIQAINDIIINAESHGFVNKKADNTIYFWVRDDDNCIVIDCANNGRTFPADIDKELFLEFGFKGSNSNGTGLGGASIQLMLDAHNAHFEIDPPNDKHLIDYGAYFRITIPKRRSDEQKS